MMKSGWRKNVNQSQGGMSEPQRVCVWAQVCEYIETIENKIKIPD